MKKLVLLFSMFAAVAVTSCSKDENVNFPSNEREPITIGLSTVGISYSDLPSSRATESGDLLAVQIYEVNGDVATPYANGLFDDWSALSFEGYSNTTYEVIATMVVDGENQLYVAAGVYGKPFESEVNSAFVYSASAMAGLTSGAATLADGAEYAVPNIDRYFGIAEAAVTAENPTITTTLKRVAFGITAEGIDGELTVAVAGAPEVTMSAGDIEIYSLENLEAAYEADEATANYSETKSVEIIKNGASVKTANVEFFRNKLATISVDTITGELVFDFETPFEDEQTDDSDEFVILTFEDADYKGGVNYAGASNWSSLIDSPQYGGVMLYGASGSGVTENPYTWTDENNTYLSSTLVNGWGSYCYWSGGHAVSNYVEMDLANGTDQYQLSVYYQDETTGKGGHNGSDNFCVHFGYIDTSGYGIEVSPLLTFADGDMHTIDHMYICNTTYFFNVALNGNSFASALTADDYHKIVATGYDLDGNPTGSVEFSLINEDGTPKEDWNKFELNSLGKVSYVGFNIVGSSDNGYGLSQPAYFAYDDVAVIL